MRGIISVTQVSIWCCNCSESLVDAHITQREAIAFARKEGWSIGKRVICPKCLVDDKKLTESLKSGQEGEG